MGWRTYELEETAWSLRRAGSEWTVAVQIRSRKGCGQLGVWFRQRLVSPGPHNRLALATPELVGFTNEMCQLLWGRGYQGSFDWERSGTVRGRFRRTIAGTAALEHEKDSLGAVFGAERAVGAGLH